MVFTNANKHSYQLQNDSRPAGAQSAYRLCRTTPVVAASYDAVLTASFASTVLNFWSPASPCNLEEDRGRSSLSLSLLPHQTWQIFDTQNPMRKKTVKLRSARIMGRRFCRCEIESREGGCGKLMWKSEKDCGRIGHARLQGAGAIRRKWVTVGKWITKLD